MACPTNTLPADGHSEVEIDIFLDTPGFQPLFDFLAVTLFVEQRRESFYHVFCAVAGEHAEEDMGADAFVGLVICRGHLQTHGIEVE